MGHLIFLFGNLSPTGKKELYYIPPIALAGYLCDGLFLDRENHTSSLKTLQGRSSDLKMKKVISWLHLGLH